MSEEINFLKNCGVFYFLTVNNGFPAGRPFGAVMELDNCLYVATDDNKDVYKQTKLNNNVQLLAHENGTRTWIRITGQAQECNDLSIKSKMLIDCPNLVRHYPTADSLHFSVFKIKVLKTELYN